MKIKLLYNRRTFFKSAALIGGSSLYMAFRQLKTLPETPAPTLSSSQSDYRLAEQIKRYYEKARL